MQEEMDEIKNYENLSDEYLVGLAADGNETALDHVFQRFREAIRGKANLFFLAGGKDDLIQEGMIGLFYAIMHYTGDRSAAFRTFAEICIERQMITAVKSAARKKHSPLNLSIPIHGRVPGAGTDNQEEQPPIEEILADPDAYTPEELVLVKDQMERIEAESVRIFSKLELIVWNEFKKGRTYTEIADWLGKSPKSIDNAIQRMKKKVEKRLELY